VVTPGEFIESSTEAGHYRYRKYNIRASLVYHWKGMHTRGRFSGKPAREDTVEIKIEKVEGGGPGG